MSHTIHIIGAGVSGLVAAIELEKRGYSCIIYDQGTQVGGRVQSDIIDGYPMDHGFQVLLTEYPAAKKWLDLEQLQLNRFRPGAEVVLPNKKSIIGDPRRDLTFLGSIFNGAVASLSDKVKTLKMATDLKSKSIEAIFEEPHMSSLEYLKKRGFSDRLILQFFRPFWAGIFLETDLNTSSRMLEFLYKMFGEGYSAIPAKGMQAIPEQLKSRLSNTTIELNKKVSSIKGQEICFENGKTESFERLIIATDPSSLLEQTEKVKWKSCYNYYFNMKINRKSTRMISLVADPSFYVNNYHFATDLIKHPAGKTILSATVINNKGKSGQALRSEVEKELQTLLKYDDIELLKEYHIRHALPIVPNVTYKPSANQINNKHNIFLAGDQLSMGSLNAAMLSGELAAKSIDESL